MLYYSLAAVSALYATALAQGTGSSCPTVTFLQRSSYSSYVALGDSYAVGLGSLQRLQQCPIDGSPASPNCTFSGSESGINSCDKDTGSYAFQFASLHVAPGGFQYSACSGANTTNVQEQQLKFISPPPDLVTIQVGGDDHLPSESAGTFANVLRNCLGPQVDFGNFHFHCPEAVANASIALGTIIGNVDRTLQAISRLVPFTTTKALVGYVQFFGMEATCKIPLGDYVSQPSLDSRNKVNTLVQVANQLLIQVAAANGFLFINPDPQYEGHRWCDAQEAWWIINTYNVSGKDTAQVPYTEAALGHPSRDGQNAYLQALTSALRI